MEPKSYNGLKGQARFNKLLSQKDKETRKKWEKEQIELKKQLIQTDQHNWTINNEKKSKSNNTINVINEDNKKEKLRYIGGVDISFDKYDKDVGISGLVVCDIEKDLK